MPKPDSATLITKHMRDLIGRPVEVSVRCAVDPNSKRDEDRRATSKGLTARAMAAQAILRSLRPDSIGNGAFETILDRMEGKVGGNEGSGGNTINFIFNNLGGQPAIPGSAGEVIQGVLAQQAITPLPLTHTPMTAPVKTSVQRALPSSTLDNGSSEDEYMPGAD